jgi:hypothetical protein
MSSEVEKNTTKNMSIFTIDLLKGQGIPPKSGPMGIVIAVITALVPVIIAITLLGLHLNSKVVMKIRQQDIVRLEAKADELSGAVKMQKALEKEKILYSACLSDVKSSIGKFTQWSPVLMTIIENMPGSVVLTDLKVEQKSVEKEGPKKDNPNKMVPMNVLVTKLLLRVSDNGQGNCDKVVKDFRDRLSSSPVFASKLENIVPSQKSEKYEGKEVVSYELNCLFNPEL